MFKSIDVKKLVEPLVDLGNLLVVDKDPIEEIEKAEKDDRDAKLAELARNNAQLLFNKIWELPRKNIQQFLPSSTYQLPREKPIPSSREPTKWEKFAREKGIIKKQRDRKVWNDNTKEWKPRYGYRRGNDNTKDWLIEIPDQKDPNKDYFDERKQNKKERINKNEFQRLKNISRSMKASGATNSNFIPLGNKSDEIFKKRQANNAKHQIQNKMYHAKNATASMGNFQSSIKGEKKANIGQKRKFESNEGSLANERTRQLELFNKLQSKKPKVNLKK